jgi:hypothetical protein
MPGYLVEFIDPNPPSAPDPVGFIDDVLDLLDQGRRWTQTVNTDGQGNYCLVGAILSYGALWDLGDYTRTI